MKRIIVIGCPGSGKTTFALRLARELRIPIFHLDSIWHKADRTHISREEFDERLGEILELDSWIIDGNYSRTVERRISACDSVILFDLPTEDCIEGAISRLGKARVDMPWIETELDSGFRSQIERFSSEVLPTIYSLVEEHKNSKEIVVFKTRAEADEYIEGLIKNRIKREEV